MSSAAALWRKLERESSGYRNSVTLELDEALFVGVDVADLLRMLARDDSSWPGVLLRVFVDGDRRRRRWEQRVLDAPPAPGEPLEAWFERLFPRGGVALLLMSAERYSEPFARRCAWLTRPVRERCDPGRHEVEGMLLLARDCTTPFGVHRDNPGSLALHTATGPGTKRMLSWTALDHDPRVYRDADACPPPDGVHPLEPRSLHLLPNGLRWHMGEVRGFSVGLALALRRLEDAELVSGALRSYSDRAPTETQPTREFDPRPGPQPLRPVAGPQVRARDWVAQLVAHHRAERSSNAGHRVPPCLDPDEVRPGARIRRLADFPLEHEKGSQRLLLWARGRPFSFRHHTVLAELLARLATEPCRWEAVDTLVRIFSDRLEAPALLAILTHLLRAGALEQAWP